MEMIEPSSEYRDATGYNHERGMPHESVTLAIAVSRETCAQREKTEIRSSVEDHAWLAQIARPTTFAPPCKGMLLFGHGSRVIALGRCIIYQTNKNDGRNPAARRVSVPPFTSRV